MDMTTGPLPSSPYLAISSWVTTIFVAVSSRRAS
jgi:hypothetical protein